MEGSFGILQPDRPSNVLDGNLMLADLAGEHSKHMQCIGMIWLDGENLPVDLLGGLQPTGLMVLDRNRQCLGNRCHNLTASGTPCTARRSPCVMICV
jgi:hypothetical protein